MIKVEVYNIIFMQHMNMLDIIPTGSISSMGPSVQPTSTVSQSQELPTSSTTPNHELPTQETSPSQVIVILVTTNVIVVVILTILVISFVFCKLRQTCLKARKF